MSDKAKNNKKKNTKSAKSAKPAKANPAGAANKNREQGEQQRRVRLPADAFSLQAQYLKDISFESPSSPQLFLENSNEEAPRVDVGVNVNVNVIAEDRNLYESEVMIKAEVKRDDEIHFIVELKYAGLTQINPEVEDAVKRLLLLVEIPRLLFPFARAIISDVTRDGGFRPLFLQPVDFGLLYQQELRRRQQAEQNKN